MARIRSIKPEFCTSLAIAELNDSEQLCFIKLWTFCDDAGRGIDDVRLVGAALYPLDASKTADVIDDLLWSLHDHGRIVRYNHQGRDYLEVVNWSEHQKPQHPKPSKYPSHEDPDAKRRDRSQRPESPHDASPDVRRSLSEHPEPEGSGGEGSVGEFPPGGAAAPASVTPLLPTKSAEGKSYTRTVAEWMRDSGTELPKDRDEVCRLVLGTVFHASPENQRTGRAIGVIGDYVSTVAGEALSNDARKHLGRLIVRHGHDAVFDAVREAIQWGAAIGEQYDDDPKALTKYVTSVLVKAAS